MSYQYYDEDLQKWVNGTPTKNGQRYKYQDPAGGTVESFWYIPEQEEPKP